MTEEYKGYLIVVAAGKGSLREIKANGKGSVAKVLRGLYTSSKEAKAAIDKHVLAREEKQNGKSKSAS
jgi:hypothetical protein